MGKLLSIAGPLLLGAMVVGVLALLFFPEVQNVFRSKRTVTVTAEAQGPSSGVPVEPLSLEIVTVLGRDGIPAITAPLFADAATADTWLDWEAQDLGVSINGDHRAYPLATLSRHEIVNDVVGGESIAATW